MLSIERNHPSFVAKAIGVLTGRLVPASDGRSGTILTKDGARIPATLHDRAIEALTENPKLFGEELDFLVWPRTDGMDLEVIVILLEPAVEKNPDRDFFLVQGMALRNRNESKVVKIGLRPNTSDRNNRSRFERFWLSLSGYLPGNQIGTVYQVQAIRKGRRLFILEARPHIRQNGRWRLAPPETTEKLRSSSSTRRQPDSTRRRELVQSR